MLALLDEYRKKTGWTKGAEVSVEDIQMRLISRFVNEVRLPLLAHIMTHLLTYLLSHRLHFAYKMESSVLLLMAILVRYSVLDFLPSLVVHSVC